MKRLIAFTVLAAILPPSLAAAQTLNMSTGPLGFFWSFVVTQTDPDARLTQINVSGVGLRCLYSSQYESCNDPLAQPIIWRFSLELDAAGQPVPTYGWTFGPSGFTWFTLVNEQGFQGTAEFRATSVITSDVLGPYDPLEEATISFTTVTPEPFTVLLLGAGLAGLAAARRRRKVPRA